MHSVKVWLQTYHYTLLSTATTVRFTRENHNRSTGAYAGGFEEVRRTPKKAYLAKIEKKKEKKSRKLNQTYHNAVYKWVKSEDFSKG